MDWLPLVEFAANNYTSELTRVTPFYTNKGRHPRFTATTAPNGSKVDSEKVTGPKKLEREQARNFATRLADLYAKLR